MKDINIGEVKVVIKKEKDENMHASYRATKY